MKHFILLFSFLLSLSLKAQAPADFSFTPTNASGTLYGQVQIDGVSAEMGDWIAAFDEGGLCVGAVELILNEGVAYINLPIYGDDATSPEDDGMGLGENFILKLYDASANEILDYESTINTVYFSNWVNTNGAPMPAYSDFNEVYNFISYVPVTLIMTDSIYCQNENDIFLDSGNPIGGDYSGPGVNESYFSPSILSAGEYQIDYTLNDSIASTSVYVMGFSNLSFNTTPTSVSIYFNPSQVIDQYRFRIKEVGEDGWTAFGIGILDGVPQMDSVKTYNNVEPCTQYEIQQKLWSLDGCVLGWSDSYYFTTSIETVEEKTACEEYLWPVNGEFYTASGEYVDTLQAQNTCDSIITLNLTILNLSNSEDDAISCDSYVWNGEIYTESGTYTYVTTNAVGCDSVSSLDLTILNSTTSLTTLEACNSYFWNGETYTESGTYTYFTTNAVGCDSVASLDLTILNSTTSLITEESCDSYFWNGETYTESGTYTYVTTNALGCDSVASLNLTILYPSYSQVEAIACGSYFWNGETYTESGTYTYVTTNTAGCDSIATLVLTIYQETSSSENVTACASFEWHGTTYTESGEYEYTTVNSLGCDSVLSLSLTINPLNYYSDIQFACDSFTWIDGVTYYESDVVASYTYLSQTEGVCDSVVVLDLTVLNSTTSLTEVEVCNSYVWNGVDYTESGTYTYVTTNAAGCDSISSLGLTILNSTTSVTTIETCDSYVWNGETYTESGTYTNVSTNTAGCDSISTLDLTILNSTTSVTTIETCDSYVWNGETYTASGQYTFSTINEEGCDSTAILDLTINYSSGTTVSLSSCDPYEWVSTGEIYDVSGTYYYTGYNESNCPQNDTLHLIISNETENLTTVSACESYYWEESALVYDSTGIYTVQSSNEENCSHTEILDLSINYSTSQTELITACDNFYWDVGDQIYSNSGIYVVESLNSEMCSHSDTLVLTITASSSSYTTITDCNNFYWDLSGEVYNTSGLYVIENLNQEGCIHTDTLDLEIGYTTTNITQETVCDGFYWEETDEFLDTTGIYVLESVNTEGCMHTEVLELTVNYPSSSTSILTSCDSYYWSESDVNYESTGVYTVESTNEYGCESTHTLYLELNESTSDTIWTTACDSFYWPLSDQSYNNSGVYIVESTNDDNCIHQSFLMLTINSSTHTTLVDTACDVYYWNVSNETYTETGIYVQESINADNCLHTDSLFLTINPTTVDTILVSACDSFFWNESQTTYNETGVYVYESLNANNCLHQSYLVLTIYQSTHTTLTDTTCDIFYWDISNETYTETGVYVVESINDFNCLHTDSLLLTVYTSSIDSIWVNACDSFYWDLNGEVYDSSGVYLVEELNEDNCLHQSFLHLEIQYSSESYITAEACESYYWNNELYTESGIYYYFSTNDSGCDSTAVLELTINQNSSSFAEITTCNYYYWNGQLLDTSGTYVFETFTSKGCDSVAILALTLTQSSYSDTSITACDSYFWNGITYDSTGTYYYNTYNSVGCDSIASLQLNINVSTTSYQEVVACDSYYWNGVLYTESALIQFDTLNTVGCDSLAVLNLTIHPHILVENNHSICEGDTIWVGDNSYTQAGSYKDVFTLPTACDSTIFTNITILENSTHTQEVHICEGEAVYVGQSVYTQAGTFIDVLTNVAGCDSTVYTTVIWHNLPESGNILGPIISAFTSEESYEITPSNNTSVYYWDADLGSVVQGQGNASVQVLWTVTGDALLWVYEETENGCLGDTTFLAVEVRQNPNSMEELLSNGLHIYPNPFTSETIAELIDKSSKTYHLKIINQEGQCLREEKVQGPVFTIQKGALAAGVYQLLLRHQKQTLTKTLIIR